MFDITNKNILITGATSGIGKAAALKLSLLGANIFDIISVSTLNYRISNSTAFGWISIIHSFMACSISSVAPTNFMK